MTLTQLLQSLLGPAAASIASWLAENFVPFRDWKPTPILGFDPKAAISGAVIYVIGLAAYGALTNVPQGVFTTVDPIMQAVYPILSLIVALLWHHFTKKTVPTMSAGG